MKAIVCEMCGGNDLIKQDGVFVCQNCGTKYSVEEARKLMVEGTVDIKGTVTVDNSAFVEKYLANARRAKEKEDWEETEKYYNMVEQNDPDNIEAIFYSAYGKAKQALIDDDIYKRQAAFKVLKNSISVIDDHYKPERQEECKSAIVSMSSDLVKMISSDFVYTQWTSGYSISTNKNQTYSLFWDLIIGFKESIDNIQSVDDHVYLHKALITLFTAAKTASWTLLYNYRYLLDEWIKEEQREISALTALYWESHKEEKPELEAEKINLEKRIAVINAEKRSLDLDALNDEKNKLLIKQYGLTAFAGEKKRRAIEEQLAALDVRIHAAEKAFNERSRPLNETLTKLTKRLEEVKSILEYGNE